MNEVVITPNDIPEETLLYLDKTVARWIPGIKYPNYYKILEEYPATRQLISFLEYPIIAVDTSSLKDIELTIKNISPYVEGKDLLNGNISPPDSSENDHYRFRKWRKNVIKGYPPLEEILRTNKLKKNNLTKALVTAQVLLEDHTISREVDIKVCKLLLQISHKFLEEFTKKFPDNKDEFCQIKDLPLYEHLSPNHKITFVKNVNSLIITVLNAFAQRL